MKKLVLKTSVIFLVALITSCVGTRKFDYTKAYKFSYIKNHEAKVAQVEPIQARPPAYLADRLVPEFPESVPVKLLPGPDHKDQELLASNPKAIRKAYKNMTKTEKKQVRESLRQTIRDLKANRSGNSEIHASLNQDNTSTAPPEQDQKKKRIAKYLLIGGGAILIIGIAASVTALTTIGVIAAVAGAILMILSLNG